MSAETVSQSEIIRKNISAVVEAQRKETSAHTPQDRLADTITNFAGSMAFVFVHIVWFALWVLLNVGLLRIPYISGFDPFPFGLLTMIVSLEAIFLSTFVLISQNRLSRASAQRAELDLQVNLLAEQKTTKVLEMLDQITRQLSESSKRFDFKTDPELEALKNSPTPKDVLKVMEEAVEEEAEEVKEAIEEITDEIEVVRDDVKQARGQLDEVVEDVDEMKEEIEEQTAELRR